MGSGGVWCWLKPRDGGAHDISTCARQHSRTSHPGYTQGTRAHPKEISRATPLIGPEGI